MRDSRKIRRRWTLSTAILAVIAATCACGAGSGEIEAEPVVLRLSERVAVVRAGSTNLVALASARGLVLIDSGADPAAARRARSAIERAFGKREFVYLINTHSHWDHTHGNQVFDEAAVVAHEACPEEMRRAWRELKQAEEAAALDGSAVAPPPPPPPRRVMNPDARARPREVAGEAAEGESLFVDPELSERRQDLVLSLPTLTFGDRLTLDLEDLTVRLLYYGEGHTASDILVLVPEEQLLATGDLFYAGQLPPLGGQARLDVPRWLAALDQVLDVPVKYVVPGHGEMLTSADLALNRDYIARLWDGVLAGRRSGLDAGDVQRRLDLKQAFPGLAGLDVRDGAGGSLHRSNVAALWEEAGATPGERRSP